MAQPVGHTDECLPIFADGRCANCSQPARVEDMKGFSYCGMCGATWGRLNKPEKRETKHEQRASYQKRR